MNDGFYFRPLEGDTMLQGRNRTQADIHRLERWYGQKGYNDALHGKPAASINQVYQVAYRRGLERRRALQDGAA